MRKLRFLTGWVLIGFFVFALSVPGEAAGAAGKIEPFQYPPVFIAQNGLPVAGEERQVIALVVKAFEAYNMKDPLLIKKVDWRYQDVKDDEVQAKFAPVGGFKLHDIKMHKASADSLGAYILYSFETTGDKHRYYAVADVSLNYRDKAWGIIETQPVPNEDEQELARQAEKAKQKYGVADLRDWEGLANTANDGQPASTAKDNQSVTDGERKVVTLVVKAFEAYNIKDPLLIKKVDWRYQDVKDDDVKAKFAPVGGFRLHDVKMHKASTDSLGAQILYSFEMTGDKHRYYALADVSLSYRDKTWGIIETQPVANENEKELAKQAEKAKQKYGVADLRDWGGLVK